VSRRQGERRTRRAGCHGRAVDEDGSPGIVGDGNQAQRTGRIRHGDDVSGTDALECREERADVRFQRGQCSQRGGGEAHVLAGNRAAAALDHHPEMIGVAGQQAVYSASDRYFPGSFEAGRGWFGDLAVFARQPVFEAHRRPGTVGPHQGIERGRAVHHAGGGKRPRPGLRRQGENGQGFLVLASLAERDDAPALLEISARYCFRRECLGPADHAHLKRRIVSPTDHGAVRTQRHGMIVSGGDGNHGLAGQHSGSINSHRHLALVTVCRFSGSGAELPEAAGAPCGESAVRTKREAVLVARRDGDHPFPGQDAVAFHEHRHIGIRCLVVSELPVVIVPPCGQGAVRTQSQTLAPTRRDGDDVLARQHAAAVHAHRSGAAVNPGLPVAQLPIRSIPPRRHRAVGAQGVAGIVTRRDGHHPLAVQRALAGHQPLG